MTYKKESPVQTLNEQNLVIIGKNDKPLTTSRKVAEIFGKQHKDVLRAIELKMADSPKDFNERNFALVKYKDSKGEKRPEYLLTKDGFIFVAMGFTGKAAFKFQIQYIETFNEMEAIITKRLYGDGVTLTELRKKVPNKQTLNFVGEEDCRMYLLTGVLKFLNYSSINHAAKVKYAGVIRKWENKLWVTEGFVKMKIRSRAALNERKLVLEDCNRIMIAEKKKAKFDRELNKKFGF